MQIKQVFEQSYYMYSQEQPISYTSTTLNETIFSDRQGSVSDYLGNSFITTNTSFHSRNKS